MLEHAHTPERPNWSVLSAQGSVADQLGDDEQAQACYAAALKIAPAQPHVLSNLGLSYALSKKLPEAETTLRKAAAEPDADRPMRQNLALVLALEGKFASAEEVARRDLDPKDASANVAAIRQMIAQSNTWKQIQALDANPGYRQDAHWEQSRLDHEGSKWNRMLQNSTSPAISGCNLGGRPWALAFFSLSQKGKVMHIADFMQWFDEGFTMVALYAAPWILTFK